MKLGVGLRYAEESMHKEHDTMMQVLGPLMHMLVARNNYKPPEQKKNKKR